MGSSPLDSPSCQAHKTRTSFVDDRARFNKEILVGYDY